MCIYIYIYIFRHHGLHAQDVGGGLSNAYLTCIVCKPFAILGEALLVRQPFSIGRFKAFLTNTTITCDAQDDGGGLIRYTVLY